MTAPACSAMALRNMGFAQSLHCTSPISEVLLSGSAPNIFMSRAESHDVGGGRADNEAGGGEGGGEEGRESKERRGAGDGECLSLSFTVIGAAWSRQAARRGGCCGRSGAKANNCEMSQKKSETRDM